MGCSCNGNIIEYMNDDKISDIVSNYIDLYNTINNEENKELQEKIYLTETDYFQKLFNHLSIDFNNNESLKRKTWRNKLITLPGNLRNPIFSIIDNIDDKSSDIELINETILKKANNEERNSYKDKNVAIIKKPNKKIELVFKNGSKSITLFITKEKKHFQIYENSENLLKMDEKNEEDKEESTPGLHFRIKNNYNKKEEENNNKNNLSNNNNNSKIIEIFNLKEMYKEFYEYYKILFEDLKSVDNLLSNPINSQTKYNEYAIISKKNYNYLIKLFEPVSYFNQNSEIFDSYEKLTPIYNLNFNIKDIQFRMKNYIQNDSFTNVEMVSLNLSNIKYPTDFILIKKDLLIKFGIKKRSLEENQFNIFFGENYLFLEINTKNSKKNIIVCSRENFFFTANIAISCVLKRYFEKEVEPYIKNRRGFDYFFNKIGFDINKEKMFRHIIDEDVVSDIYIINYKPKQIEKINKIITKKENNEIKVNQKLKSIIISLYLIEQLSQFLKKFEYTNTDLTSLFIEFIHEFPYKYENGMSCINKIEIILENMNVKNNFKDRIDSILDNIHMRLGGQIYYEEKFGEDGNALDYVLLILKIIQ